MFSSYNLKDYGAAVRSVRKNCKFTQAHVSRLCGINIDTLRRIENAQVIPKYETLELLSGVYKYDLLKLLITYREEKDVMNLHLFMDQASTSNNLDMIKELPAKFEALLSKDINSTLINKSEIKLIDIFIDETIKYYDAAYKDYSKSIDNILNYLKTSNSYFDHENFADIEYNFIELRLLMTYALFLVKEDKLEESTKIFLFLLQSLCKEPQTNESYKILIKLYLNVSYNYHRLSNNNLAIKYADEGIQLAISNDSIYCLPHLYFRKGIAQYLSGMIDYEDALVKSDVLLDIYNNPKLRDIYRTSATELYGINSYY